LTSAKKFKTAPMTARTPLAWKNLTYDGRRLAVAVSGVGFAVVLIFMELGFLNALLESTVQVLRILNGELFVISSAKYALPARDRFDIRRVRQSAAVPGVKAVSPFYMETLGAVLRPPQSRGYPIRVLAFHDSDDIVGLGSLGGQAAELDRPGSALADRASRPKYGIPSHTAQLAAYDAELSGRDIHLAGHFRLGVDFATDGNLLMTAANFAHFFPNRAPGRDPLSLVDLALVKLDEHANPQTVQRLLRAALASDVDVLTKEELIEREMAFWRSNAPVGYIFLVGVYMGFVVGVIICYQIIYSDIADHMREFATLKAMGYANPYFLRLVLCQSLYLSLLGFLPGVVVSYACYAALSAFTGLTMQLTLSVSLVVLLVTIAMCAVSGILAVRKLLSADPAELF
jgi:putative ABC transport system permease protein